MPRRRMETPENCKKCGRFIPGACNTGRCIAYSTLVRNCSSYTSDRLAVIKLLEGLKANCKSSNNTAESLKKDITALKRVYEKELKEAYIEDTHRGTKGSNSESDANKKTSMKQKMKDNRPIECKTTVQGMMEYKEALQKFEEEKGIKLDKLQPNDGLTRNKIDSYTGEEIK